MAPLESHAATTLADWQRDAVAEFCFTGRKLDLDTGEVLLEYRLDDRPFVERLIFPGAPLSPSPARRRALKGALELLHWTAGVSYYKAACPPTIRFAEAGPDPWQADWLTRLYRHGLAEFAHCNGLEIERIAAFPSSSPRSFSGSSQPMPDSKRDPLTARTLVPMGGGKDSLVAWQRLQDRGCELASVQIGDSALIHAIGDRLPGHHWQVRRRLDPALLSLNARGAWNGHVPVTAINSAILTLLALLLDCHRVAFANERSAEEASRLDGRGRAINHQFSKSLVFEQMLDAWIRRYVHSELRVFSLLRRDRELAICRDFAGLTQYHALFSSCNRNFHLDGARGDRWCGRCPKCHFVYLCLAPFMHPDALRAVFGEDLLARADQIEGFGELLALDGTKPFECVGEAAEARAALKSLAMDPHWSEHRVVRALAPRLQGVDVPTLESLCRQGGAHLIPQDLIDAA